MHIICLLLLLLPGLPDITHPEQSGREKIQTILVLQDQRRGTDPRLASFLSDSDAVVRERAALACASIQDTMLIPRLLPMLRDRSARVREAAAFAVGQTGSILTASGRDSLEQHCLRLISSGDFPPRLLEEVGKFASASCLSRLAVLIPDKGSKPAQEALVMGIARFAIRGIASDESYQLLVRLLNQPLSVSWQTVYGLQRFPPRTKTVVPALLQLTRHQDPLVRLNAATALGKVGDTLGSGEILGELTSNDPDWRVRVNALKAMGALGPPQSMQVVDRFTASFTDSNEHVALTAMATFGETFKASEKISQEAEIVLWKIAEGTGSNVTVRRRAEAFTALARVRRSAAYPRLSLIHPPDDRSQARYLIAIGLTGDPRGLTTLTKGVGHKHPLVASSALEGLQHLSTLNPGNPQLAEAVMASALEALDRRDVSVISTAASLLADSLFRTPEAVPALVRTLRSLQEPGDVEAMQQVIQTLGTLRDRRATEPLIQKLSSSDRTVAETAAAALKAITGRDYSDEIRVSIQPTATTGDSGLLARLSDTLVVRMQTSTGGLVLELYTQAAPYTVLSFLKLAARHFYDGLPFHRVVPNFVVQGGDPRGDGWGGPGYSIRSEFSLLRYERGMLGMASAGKDTEGSQFFITHSPQPHLDGRYTIFGRVRDGMDLVDRLQVGDTITNVVVETQ